MLLPQSRCLHCACIAIEFSESCRVGRLLGSGSRYDINARASHRSGLVLDAVMSSILMPLSICILRMLAGGTLGSGSHHAINAHATVDMIASGGRSPTGVWQPSWHQRSCLSILELVGCQIGSASHYPINTAAMPVQGWQEVYLILVATMISALGPLSIPNLLSPPSLHFLSVSDVLLRRWRCVRSVCIVVDELLEDIGDVRSSLRRWLRRWLRFRRAEELLELGVVSSLDRR